MPSPGCRCLAVLVLTLPGVAQGRVADERPAAFWHGTWRAWLDSPGGPLPFGLVLEPGGRGFLVNGAERIAVPWEGTDGGLRVALPPYDAQLTGAWGGEELTGQWVKRRGAGKQSALPLHAVRVADGADAAAPPRFAPPKGPDGARAAALFAGTWRVVFGSDPHAAVGTFAQRGPHEVTGTFRTALGDYRYLAGDRYGDTLRLSCFDGAHAFLFVARLEEDGSLRGDFWSADNWHEPWRAVRHSQAVLDDPFRLSTWNDGVDLASLRYPDVDGVPRSLADPAFAGKARILQLFGSWCPNCNDASAYLTELHRRYGEQGLSVVGLAFEFGEDHAENAARVRAYRERHASSYPVLIAGPADKAQASAAFPALDRVRAYPTTIFLDGQGKVRAVHTGFDGPATGAAHAQLRERFELLIEGLLRGDG